jgi:Protein of unknown function (DUF2764)
MNEYYFLASLLPSLEIGHVPTLGFSELKTLMDTNLSRTDRQKVRDFLNVIDFENMRALWANEPFEPRGNCNPAQLEQALQDHQWPFPKPFPTFLIDFLEKYRTPQEKLNHFSLLMSQFFAAEISHETGFVRDYFAFQRELRLVLLGFRAKKWGKNVAAELQYEDGSDPIVAQILAQSDAKVYEPPFEYKELKPIFETYANSPLEMHKALYEYQFNHIIELWGNEPFTVDRILNYLARLILVERWLELDVQKGIQIVDRIEKEIT